MGLRNKFIRPAETVPEPTTSAPEEPTVESEVFGLELIVEKKAGTLPLKGYLVEDSYYQVTIKSTGENEEYPGNDNAWTKNYTRFLPGQNIGVAGMGTLSTEAVRETVRFTGFQLAEDPSNPSFFRLTAFLEGERCTSATPSWGLRFLKEDVRETCQRAQKERDAAAAEKERERVKEIEKARISDVHATAALRQKAMKQHAKKLVIK